MMQIARIQMQLVSMMMDPKKDKGKSKRLKITDFLIRFLTGDESAVEAQKDKDREGAELAIILHQLMGGELGPDVHRILNGD